MSIEHLSDVVISQIAAGEVIERPASVVKELIENALDAGATTIHVASERGGQRLIRVSDNGSGIPSDEVEVAFARHATSKLRVAEDLNHLLTLGFRGEALSSIASVSRTTLTTRHRDEQIGSEIRLEGGALIRQQPIGAPAGTVITVEDLFFNTPARLKFLKTEATEKRYINSIVSRYAMAYPAVRFVYEQDRRELFGTTGSGQLADVIVKVMGIEQFKQSIEVSSSEKAIDNRPEIQVFGYTSLPELTRGDRTQITLFVNGRWIQDTRLTYAIVQAYQTFIPSNRYPIAVLMIDLPPDEVDVNVHPAKAEVRFRHPDHVFAALQRAVRETIIASQQPGEQRFRKYDEENIVQVSRGSWNSHIQLDLNLSEVQNSGTMVEKSDQFNADTAIPDGPDAPHRPRTLPPLRVIGQIGAMYIVAEGPAGMYLIDQNAAHTRIIYETLLEQYEAGQDNIRQVSTGETIELTTDEAKIVEQYTDDIARMGLKLEIFGPATFIIRGLPTAIPDNISSSHRMVQDMAKSLDKAKTSEIIASIANAIASYSATKAGQILDIGQMREIIRKLERCASPHTAPDGRATLIHLSGDQLAREFARS